MNIADFEEPAVAALFVAVCAHRAEQAADERCAHKALILAEGVLQANGVALFVILRNKQQIIFLRRCEIVIIKLHEAHCSHCILHPVFNYDGAGKPALEGIAVHEHRLNVIVAVKPPDFFRNIPVGFDSVFNIRAEVRNLDTQLVFTNLSGNADGRKQLRHGFSAEFRVKNTVDMTNIRIHDFFGNIRIANVDHAADDPAGSENVNKFNRTVDRKFRIHGFNALCEPCGGVG